MIAEPPEKVDISPLLVHAEDLAVESVAVARTIALLEWWELRARRRAKDRLKALTYLRLAVLSEITGAMRERQWVEPATIPDGTNILTREAVDEMISIYSVRQIDLARRAITAIIGGRVANAEAMLAKLSKSVV